MRWIHVLLITLIGVSAFADPPAGYYDSAQGKTGAELSTALHNIIQSGHVQVGYDNAWTALQIVDTDPSNSNNIIAAHSGISVDGSDTNICSSVVNPNCSGGCSCEDTDGTTGLLNREHIFPQSEFTEDEPARSDLHALILCDADINQAHSNKTYAVVDTNTSSALSGTNCKTDSDFFEPADSMKGNVARAMLYMCIRYEGDTGEPDLQLANSPTATANDGVFGDLATLLQWHSDDPVDTYEYDRNDLVYSIQGNRNPFIDHPEWVALIDFTNTQTTLGGDVWINEIHYDNASGDIDEGVEIAGVADTSLNGWSLVLYNGNGGAVYDTISLSGVIPNQPDAATDPAGSGYGTLWFAATGLQNGAPDGVALIDDLDSVIQFLSYEGNFTATDGPANGMTSEDIGVSEDGSATGMSLQLVDPVTRSGQGYSDFDWSTEMLATPGDINTGQTFTQVTRVSDWEVFD